MPVDIDSMTPREMTAGLMRGDRVDMKRGYSAESAALVAADFKGLSVDEKDRLLAFAYGFADGIAESIERTDPVVQYERYGAGIGYDTEYLDGLTLGRSEAGMLLYPTLKIATPNPQTQE